MNKLNPMCETCAEKGRSCAGTTEPVWTGCVYRKVEGLKIYFFESDPEIGFVKAGYTVDGKRYVSIVWTQDERLYVRTGAKITGDLVLHWLSKAQTTAFDEFIKGQSWAVEFKEGIA